jgi:hypothetical protein
MPDEERHLLERGFRGIDTEPAAEAQVLVEAAPVGINRRRRPAQVAEQR